MMGSCADSIIAFGVPLGKWCDGDSLPDEFAWRQMIDRFLKELDIPYDPECVGWYLITSYGE